MLPMLKPDEELREATKLVLYGWGYPALFNAPNGDRLQNRLVLFRADASPGIQGASQEALCNVLPRLKLIKKRYLDFLKANYSDVNPLWVWVDTPENLSINEILQYREQFDAWVEHNKVYIESNRWTQAIESILNRWQTLHWKQTTIAIMALLTITLAVLHTLATPVVACPEYHPDVVQSEGYENQCLGAETLTISPQEREVMVEVTARP